MHELPDADRARVSIPGDPESNHLAVGDHRAGAHRRHAPVDRIEAMGAVQEIRGGLARAADTRELDDLRRVDAELEEGVDDALGDRVVLLPGNATLKASLFTP